MANPVKGEVGFEVDDKTYTLLLDINALCIVEERLGIKSITELEFGEGMSIRTIRSIFWAGLQEHHPDLTEKEAGRLMTGLGATVAAAHVMDAVRLAFPESKGRPQAAAAGTQAGTGKGSTPSGAS